MVSRILPEADLSPSAPMPKGLFLRQPPSRGRGGDVEAGLCACPWWGRWIEMEVLGRPTVDGAQIRGGRTQRSAPTPGCSTVNGGNEWRIIGTLRKGCVEMAGKPCPSDQTARPGQELSRLNRSARAQYGSTLGCTRARSVPPRTIFNPSAAGRTSPTAAATIPFR